METGRVIEELAPAKVNLYLEVSGQRADGFHLLESLVAFVDVGDGLSIREAPAFSLALEGPFARELAMEPVEGNLVTRAARSLAAAVGRAADVAVTLEKRLPIASGIGGGSADAAATLRGLARLWGLPLGDQRVGEVARGLGQDVPACLASAPCFFRGIGDETEPIWRPLPPLALVLVNPGEAVPTPAAFRARQGSFTPARPFGEMPKRPAEFVERLAGHRNDLTEAAVSIAPGITDVMRAISASSGCQLARMSGSGATCFGLFADQAEACAAAGALTRHHPGWWIKTARWHLPSSEGVAS